MKRDESLTLGSFLLELVVYAALVLAYFFLVLHLLGDWLNRLFHEHPNWYAAVALGFIVIQGFVLEAVTRGLLGWIKSRRSQA